MRGFATSVAVLAAGTAFASADPLNCTFRSPIAPVQLSVTDGYTHAKSIGTKVRTCDKTTCGDGPDDHKFIDCPADLAVGNTTTSVLVDDDLVYIQFLNEDTGTFENFYPPSPPIQSGAISLPLRNYSQSCTYRSPDSPVTLTIHNTEKTTAGIKVRTCDEDECSDGGHKYVDCPMHLPLGTSTIFVDNDLHFLVFFNEDSKTSEEYWPPSAPVTGGDITLPLASPLKRGAHGNSLRSV